jgi:hypothetical protein
VVDIPPELPKPVEPPPKSPPPVVFVLPNPPVFVVEPNPVPVPSRRDSSKSWVRADLQSSPDQDTMGRDIHERQKRIARTCVRICVRSEATKAGVLLLLLIIVLAKAESSKARHFEDSAE